MGYLVLKGEVEVCKHFGWKTSRRLLGHTRVDERIILKLLKNEDVNM
jgi:hypothetical protein